MKYGRLLLLCSQLAITVVLLTLLFFKGVAFKADLLSALPESQYPEPVKLAEQALFAKASGRLVFSIEGLDKIKAYDDLLLKVKESGWQAQLPDSQMLDKLARFYSAYPGYALSDDYKKALTSAESYQHFFLQQVSQISSPWLSRTINHDPSLASYSFLESLFQSQPTLTIENSRFVANHVAEKPLLLMVQISDEPALSQSVDYSILVADKASEMVSEIQDKYPNTQLLVSGMAMHTAENANNAKWEMNVFGGISLLATLALVIWALRSLAPILWISLIVGNTLLFGFSVLALVFGTVHFITLVFGVMLIGLGVDYCLHVLVHRASSENASVGKTLFFAFLTTGLCYCLLYFTPLVILQQVAVFVVSGLFAALVMSLWIEKSSLCARLITKSKPINVSALRNFLIHSPKKRLFAGAVLLIAIVIKPPVFDDSVAKLNASSDLLTQAQTYHYQLLDQGDKHRVFIYDDSLQGLLQRQESLVGVLSSAFAQAKITSLSHWIPSQSKQQNNREEFLGAQQRGIFSTVLSQSLARDNDEYITLDSFIASNGTDYFAHNYVEVGAFHVGVIEVKGVPLMELESLLSSFEQAIVFDKQSSLSNILKEFRELLSYWLLGAIALLSAMLWFKFEWQTMVKSVTVIAMSISGALLISGFYQETLNIFNLLSAILVIGLAIDYLIFYRGHPATNANVLAISLSAASSLLVFGMLAFSSTPAIYSFGITVSAGLVLVYLLAPLVIKE